MGCRDAAGPERDGPAAPVFSHGGAHPRITGLGAIGSGSAAPGSDRKELDFDVSADLAGRLFYRDWTVVRSDGTVGTLTVDADSATGITAFRDGSAACADSTRGAEFGGTGRLDTGTLVSFTVVACDNGAAGSGADFFGLAVAEYSQSGLLSAGDILKESAPATGDLTVGAATTGSNLDPNGYTVTVDGTAGQAAAPNDTVTFAAIASGDHSVALSDVAANCTVNNANPRTVTVPAGGVGSTTFEVSCTASSGTARITGLGAIGSGSAAPGSDRRDFDFDVAADLAGRLFYRDWTVVRSDGTVGTLTVDADSATGITAFRDGSAACADSTRGAEFGGTGRLDTGTLVNFTVVACDNGVAGSGADFFAFAVALLGYSRSGFLSTGDIADDPASTFYVSPSGSPSGDGRANSPWDLQTALNHPAAVQPGDTIWLRGGTYHGMYASYLAGTADQPIIVRQYPGERATIDGGAAQHGLVTLGAHTWFWGFEVMSGSGHVIVVHNSVGDRFINLVVHDAGWSGFGSFTGSGSRQTEIHGSIVYNNGREYNQDHGIYAQNDVATGTFHLTDNIVFNNWARGIQVYGKVDIPGAAISGFVIEGNVAFHNGAISIPVNQTKQIMAGGTVPASDIVVRRNYTYWSTATPPNPDALSLNVGYVPGPVNGDVVVEDNYIVGGLYLGKWASALVRGNVVYDYAGPLVVTDSGVSGHTWDANRFYGDSIPPNWMQVPNAPAGFATWKAQTGFANPGGYAGSGAPPNLVVVRPNKYEAGRANIIVYNWEQLNTVSVDVSGVLTVGDRYVVLNVQDFYGPPVAGGTYDGSALQLPMAGITPPAPIGRSYTPAPVTGPTFNAFVLMRAP